ncbi:lipopolysaccharide biosynthesis protein [Aquimarina sp. SS2-1]|uniref:lipopolysaccharide biosynthesis protein n=1 Tax=Aquimarina besae TaxID=3342247 RepID=UPI00366A9178
MLSDMIQNYFKRFKKSRGSNKIFKNAIIYSIGNYSSKFIAIIVFPIVVTYLGLEDTGKLDLIVSTVTILATIFSLQIGEAVYRWFSTNDLAEQQISFSNGIVVLVIMVMLCTVLYVLGYFFYTFPKDLWTLSYFILVSHIVLNAFFQIIRGLGKVTVFTVVGIIKSILYTAASLLVAIFTQDKLYNVLLALLLSNIIGIILTIYHFDFIKFYRHAEVTILNLKKLIKYSVPLIINALSWISFFAVNKYIILYNLELDDNGIFAVAEKIAIGIFFIGMFYYYSLQDHCLSSNNFRQEGAFFKKIVLRTILMVISSILLLQLTLWIVMPILFPNLVISLNYLPFLAFANLFIVLSSYLGIPYNYKKKTISMAITSLAGLTLTLVLSMILVSSFGLYGVCTAILIGAVLVFLIRLKYNITFFKTE